MTKHRTTQAELSASSSCNPHPPPPTPPPQKKEEEEERGNMRGGGREKKRNTTQKMTDRSEVGIKSAALCPNFGGCHCRRRPAWTKPPRFMPSSSTVSPSTKPRKVIVLSSAEGSPLLASCAASPILPHNRQGAQSLGPRSSRSPSPQRAAFLHNHC